MSRLSALAASIALVATLTGCGAESDSPSGEAGSSSTPSAQSPSTQSTSPPATASPSPRTAKKPATGQRLTITVTAASVTPADKRISVKKGAALVLTISAERAGELHVHSSPEQTIGFDEGTTTKRLSFAVPGLVEIEEHESGVLIATLEVR